jgi:hypothetical protein
MAEFERLLAERGLDKREVYERGGSIAGQYLNEVTELLARAATERTHNDPELSQTLASRTLAVFMAGFSLGIGYDPRERSG